MRGALACGADAVYAGLPRCSLRARNNDFDRRKLARGIFRVILSRELSLEATRDQVGMPLQTAPGARYRVRIPLPLCACRPGLLTRVLR
jgi:hypothetical protein